MSVTPKNGTALFDICAHDGSPNDAIILDEGYAMSARSYTKFRTEKVSSSNVGSQCPQNGSKLVTLSFAAKRNLMEWSAAFTDSGWGYKLRRGGEPWSY
jgi:hypothetical protein